MRSACVAKATWFTPSANIRHITGPYPYCFVTAVGESGGTVCGTALPFDAHSEGSMSAKSNVSGGIGGGLAGYGSSMVEPCMLSTVSMGPVALVVSRTDMPLNAFFKSSNVAFTEPTSGFCAAVWLLLAAVLL